MHMESNQMDELQILAYLKGEELSSSQTEVVEKWLQSEVNKTKARALYQTWELSALAAGKEPDKPKAWKTIKTRSGVQSNSKRIVELWPSIGIAAAFSAIALTCLFIFLKSDTKPVTVFQTKDIKLTAIAPDSSIIVLNKNASATYSEDDGSRIVNLDGEAYFDVKAKTDTPFIVQTFNTQVKVLGTKFCVKPLPDSSVQVLVTEGSVSVTNLRSGETYIVNPGEELFMNKVQRRISNGNDLYWVTETLKFENEPLSNVFDILSKEFDIIIELSNPKISDCRITATFKKQRLQTILTVIEKTHAIKFAKKSNAYVVKGKGCHE